MLQRSLPRLLPTRLWAVTKRVMATITACSAPRQSSRRIEQNCCKRPDDGDNQARDDERPGPPRNIPSPPGPMLHDVVPLLTLGVATHTA